MDSVATMPNKLKVDYAQAFELFCQGQTYREIAAKMGCKEASLRQHGSRANWAKNTIQALVATKSAQTLQERAEQWISATACDIERTVATLARLPIPQTIAGLKQHEEVWGMHVKRGRSTFGLDQQGTNVQINIGRFGKASIEPVQDQAQVIDIPPSD